MINLILSNCSVKCIRLYVFNVLILQSIPRTLTRFWQFLTRRNQLIIMKSFWEPGQKWKTMWEKLVELEGKVLISRTRLWDYLRSSNGLIITTQVMRYCNRLASTTTQIWKQWNLWVVSRYLLGLGSTATLQEGMKFIRKIELFVI